MTPSDDVRILNTDPVFVTAFSDNHFGVAFRFVVPMLRTMTEKFVVYDLGLNSTNLQRLKTLPYVSAVRRFDYSMYPEYVRDLFQYRWKPLLIAEMLREHEVVFYADAHVVWRHTKTFAVVLKSLRSRIANGSAYEMALLGVGSNSIASYTSEKLYDYLPTNQTGVNRTRMGQAGIQLVHFTRDVRSNVCKWNILCALEKECMAPNGTVTDCGKPGDCHRQDQSVINILLANRNRFLEKRYMRHLTNAVYFRG